jgi:flavin reductase (DIM6/NTAB) family NADH-FMN oxidoreductase RutF
MSFIELPPGRANRLINHGPTVLVTGGHGHQANIMTAAWIMPASHTPPMLAVAIGPTRHSHQLIIEGGEFGVNIPAAGLLEAVWTCGTTSGRKGNKFELCGLTPIRANRWSPRSSPSASAPSNAGWSATRWQAITRS